MDLLLTMVEEAYRRKAWHGPNLRGALRGVTAKEAAWRPAKGRHNIWELAVHAAYWKYAVRRRLTGEKRGRFILPGSNWFARPDPASPTLETDWQRDVALLDAEHRLLLEAVAAVDATKLDQPAAGSRQTPLTLIRGVAFHDVYHAGQVQLLKRLSRE
ncbi:MAG TPA: DinB family protein [Vicinamibacteria bacterium]|jgi:uncharacterized damage-inducible protein DinB